MKKDKNIKKHVNIHIITLLVTILVVAILDSIKIYSISPIVMTIFMVGYSIYIIFSTIYLLSKYDYLDSSKEKSWNKKVENKMKEKN